MSQPIRVFFRELGQRHQPSLESARGVVRIDLADGERTEHWYLDIDRGDVHVSHRRRDADCTLRTDLATFEAMIAGRQNAMAAVLRGAVEVEGKFVLLTLLQRLFPGPAAAAEAPAAGYARRRT